MNKHRPFVQSTAETDDFVWQIKLPDKNLIQINKKEQTRYIYRPDPFNDFSISGDLLSELYLDSNKILWIGTSGSGVYYADTRQKMFSIYHNRNRASSNDVRAICRDHAGNIWVGNQNDGIGILDRKTNTYTHVKLNIPEPSGAFNINQIRVLYCDKYGFIWIGTKAGLRRLKPSNNSIKDYTVYSGNFLPNNWIFDIMEDHKGDLWIATFNGIAKYNRKEDRFYSFGPQFTGAGSRVKAIIEDRKWNIWVGTDGGGLICLKRNSSDGFKEDFTSVQYIHNVADSNSISSNCIYAMDIDENGCIWLATSKGVNIFDPDKGDFKHISEQDGLPDNNILAVLYDMNGFVWASHVRGISRIEINSFKITSYSGEDGLQDKDFLEGSCFHDTISGELFFGGTDGVNSFCSADIVDNALFPKVYIKELAIQNRIVEINEPFNGRVVLKKPIYLTKEITLTHDDRTVSLEFTGVHFSNPQRNKFMYKLEGVDNEWIETDASDRRASYSNLKPGNYEFKVMAANSDDIWNPQPATLHIKVLPPWWLSGWAYALYSFFVSVFFWLSMKVVKAREKYKHEIELEKLKADKLAEFDNLKSRFFTNIAHELRTPLSLILDPLNKILEQDSFTPTIENYLQIMQRNATRLYRLTNQLLDFKKIESGKLEISISENDMVSHISAIYSSFKSQAILRHIKYSFVSSNDHLLVCYDREKIETIMYNLISNAFKYTPSNGEITITLLASDNKNTGIQDFKLIQLKVTDSGKGIDPDSLDHIFEMFYTTKGNGEPRDKSYGIGLAFTKELVELQGGNLHVESELGKGSCFTVALPVNHAFEKPNKIIEKDNPSDIKSDSTPNQSKLIRGKSKGGQLNVLLIDDNSEIRSYLADELRNKYNIYEADNGLDGIKIAAELIPDLIVSDIMMPGINGIELCKRLKTDLRTSHIPIILLTAKQSEENIVEGYQIGADAYIVKPFSTLVLNSRIENLIQSRTKLKELFCKNTFIDTRALTNNATDEAFINKVINIVLDNISEPKFNSEMLADKLKISRALLYKKIKSLTGSTVHYFIMSIKMNKASEMLLSGEYNISEIAYELGFSVVGNFSRSFSNQFGTSPSKFIEKHKNEKSS